MRFLAFAMLLPVPVLAAWARSRPDRESFGASILLMVAIVPLGSLSYVVDQHGGALQALALVGMAGISAGSILLDRWARRSAAATRRHTAPTVARPEFMTPREAAETLGLRLGAYSVRSLVMTGALQTALLDDGSEGVTRSSVERELAWRRSAPRRARAARWMTR